MKRTVTLLSCGKVGVALGFLFFLFSVSSSAQVQWEQTNGPAGGYIQILITGPDSIVYATLNNYSVEGNPMVVYRSENNGNNWVRSDNFYEKDYINGIDSNGNLYSSVVNDPGLSADTLFRSQDDGDTWTPVFTGSIAIREMMESSGKLYAYGSKLIVSEDQGLTWTVTDTTQNYLMAVNSAGNLFKPRGTDLLISEDDGLTWSYFADITPIFDDISSIAINPQDEIYVGGYGAHLYRISPDGSTTELVTDLFSDIPDIEIAPNGTIFAQSYLGHMEISYDNGITWATNAMTGMYSTTREGFEMNPDGVVFALWNEGIYKTENNGESWVSANEGINHLSVNALHNQPGTPVFASTTKRIFRLDDNGNDWQQVYGTNIYYFIKDLYLMPDGNLFMVQEEIWMDKSPCDEYSCNFLYRSTDGGTTWTQVLARAGIYDVEMNSSGKLFLLAGNEIQVSEDDGLTWDSIPTTDWLYSIVIDSSGIIYGQAAQGYYKSVDDAQNWELISSPEYPEISEFIEFEVSDAGVLFSITNYLSAGDYFWALYRSNDQGVTWSSILTTPEGLFDIHAGLYNHLYIASYEGILRSSDNGDTWDNISEDINRPFTAITEDSTGVLYAGASSQSVYRTESYVPVNSPFVSSLLSIHPNPVTNYLLTVSIPTGTSGEFSIYNSRGELQVRGQVPQSGKTSSFTLDVSNLVPGLYLITVNGKGGKFVRL